MHKVKIKDFFIGEGEPLTIIAGPCVIESEEHAFSVARALQTIFQKRNSQLIFKSSYDKANRSSHDSFRGPGLDEGLRILQKIQSELNLPVLTDVHSPNDAMAAGDVCDVLQIPAFLCRQTDLIESAGKTKRTISVKKGQFMSPWEMENVVKKLEAVGNSNIILVDRGTSFGYHNLVSDMRSIPIMQSFGFPVCFDATHSVQLPGGNRTQSGGQREFIPVLAKASIAAGANLIFMETHPEPEKAKSDAACVYPLDQFSNLLDVLERLYAVIQE